MTGSDHEVSDLLLSTRPPSSNAGRDLPDGYRVHGIPGWKQLACAWFILLTFAMLFKITDFISANRTAPFARTTELARMADFDRMQEIERWERGEPRQLTMTMPKPHVEVLVSGVEK